uniref:LysR family transcriptional regulator n=1 Tax=uncultured Altererythrobacter sp. TaxID=500840 RepID=UPI002628D0D0|nr:LysR family transcriptional regulator [uncultured Altererythrobacter sp.]
MRLRQIEIFYHVYRAGSISGAARDLNVSQPSVSKVLRHAEDQLGVELFLRSKGKLVPTAAAHELFSEAEDIYARLSTFNRSLENISNRRGGHLRLGVLPSLSLSLGPELVAQMISEDAGATFELTTLHSAQMRLALIEKQVDMTIGFEPIDDERLRAENIGSGGMVLVSGKSVSDAGAELGITIVNGAPFISMRDSGPLAQLVSSALKQRGLSPREIVSAHTYHVALSLVRKRIGMTITDEFTAYSHLASGLHRYPLKDFPKFPLHATALANHPEQAMIDRAMRHARDAASALGSGIKSLQTGAP